MPTTSLNWKQVVGTAREVRAFAYDATILSSLLVDLRLDEPCQIAQRFLPAEIASLDRNDLG